MTHAHTNFYLSKQKAALNVVMKVRCRQGDQGVSMVFGHCSNKFTMTVTVTVTETVSPYQTTGDQWVDPL